MTTTATKPPPQRGGNPTWPHTTTNDRNPTHQYLVCYECGQTGHIKPNCPKLKGNVWLAAARVEDILDETENIEDEEGTSGINQEDQQEVDLVPMVTQTADEWVEEAS